MIGEVFRSTDFFARKAEWCIDWDENIYIIK